jgi:hypothetical protein
MTILAHSLARWAAILGLLLVPVPTAQAAGAARLFTPSDYGMLRHGLSIADAGEYTLKIWAPEGQEWTLQANGQALTLRVKARSQKGDTPRWQTAGRAKLVTASPVTVQFAVTEGEGKKELPKNTVPGLILLTNDSEADPSPALDIVRGRIDTVQPPDDPRQTSVRTNQEGINFRAPRTPPAWRERARAVREQLLVALGLWPMPPKTPLHPQIFGKLERNGYTIEKVVLETFPGFTLSGNLYRPTGQPGRRPALLCPHGHWEDGRVNPEVQARCIHWAKLGCVVFLYDMVGYNDSKAFGHHFQSDRLRRWGLSLAGLQTWNSLRALDWLITLPDVDVSRIGCTGESGGGTQTFLLTAIDDRIKVAAPVVMVSDSFQGGCECENPAGLRIGTDNVEIAALTAPRPLKLVGATGDWTANTMFRAYPAIKDVYALVGVPDHVSADVFNFPHNYNKKSRNSVYIFMSRWLLGSDDPEHIREGDQSPERPEDLRTFSDEHPVPPGLKTPEQLEAELVQVMARQLDSLAPGQHTALWQASRALLRTALRIRVGLVNPPPAALGAQHVRTVDREGLTIVHMLVGRRASGEQIPVVRLVPAHASGRLAVVMSSRGKAVLVDDQGQPAPLVRALLQRGQSVIGFDPLLIGESVDPSSPAERRPETSHFATYNPALAADRAQDLATVLAWAQSQPDVRDVSLVATDASGPVALLARPLLEGLARAAIDLNGFDYGDGSGEVPLGLDLPGVLQFGGLKAAAALAAPTPLWLYRARGDFDTSWPARAYALADASVMLRTDASTPDAAAIARWIDVGEAPPADADHP